MTTINAQNQEMNFESIFSPSISYSQDTMPPPLVPCSRETQFYREVDMQCDLFIPTLSPIGSQRPHDENEKIGFSLLPRPSLILSSSSDLSAIPMAIDEDDRNDGYVLSYTHRLSIQPEVSLDDTFSVSDSGSMRGLPDFPDLAEISSYDSESETSSANSYMDDAQTQLRPRLPSKIELAESIFRGFSDS